MGRKAVVVSETAEDSIQRAKSDARRAFVGLEVRLEEIRDYMSLTARYEINTSCDACNNYEENLTDMSRIQAMLSEAFGKLHTLGEAMETLHFADIHM